VSAPAPLNPAQSFADGIRIRLKVQPKAKRNAIQGLLAEADGSRVLKVAVNAPPEDGKANAAVAALLAAQLGVAKSAVSVVSGATDRRKLVEIRGTPAELSARLAALIEAFEERRS
jgi:uncharacterized protein (TIGR00251 family)